MNYEEAKIAAKQIGFSHIIRCEGKPSILAPYRSLSNKMSGCYLQFRADDILYIGQSKNIPNRYLAHRSHGHIIYFIAFKPCAPEALDEVEDEMIFRAEALGFRLANRAPKSAEADPLSFDEVVPPHQQDAFLERFKIEIPFQTQMKQLAHGAGDSHRADWLHFKRLPKAVDMIRIAGGYLRTVLPAEELAGVFYRVTLGYRQNLTAFQPALRLIFGVHTLFVVGFLRQLPTFPVVSVTVSTEVLLNGKTKEEFENEFTWLSVEWNTVQTDRAFSPTHKKVIYPSPFALREDEEREVSQALAKGLSKVTMPLEVLPDLLLEPAFARAAALAAIAAMRWSSPTSDEHNRLASFALDTGYMP